MRKVLSIAGLVLLGLTAGCSMSESSDAAGAGSHGPAAGLSSGDVAAPSGNGQGQVDAGILTAGTWDDNRNFQRFIDYRSELEQSMSGMLPIDAEELTASHELWLEPAAAKAKLDIALVIDTTGSMGDEIRYLQSEFKALSDRIASDYPDSEQRWSLVVYRDTGDDYVSRKFDFTSSAASFQQSLAQQSADGGGDLPEAPERAFQDVAQLDWRQGDDTARLAFWVADAPHHDERAATMAEALRGMQDLGVHVYPVASSGVDELAELSMRTAAMMTGGRYLFLTDDSGVGNDHKEPTLPCYFVTKLNDAVLRMVDIELSGVYREPSEAEIIRTGGNPHDGACELESGDSVFVF